MFQRIVNVLIMGFWVCLPYTAQAGAKDLLLLTEESPPSVFYDQNGELTGISIDVVTEIMNRVDRYTKIHVLPWARAYVMAQKEANAVLFATTRTQEREPLFKWIGPIIRIKWVLYGKKGTSIVIRNLEDAKAVGKIGTYINDAREQYLVRQGFTNLESVSNNVLNFRKLVTGRIDLMASSNAGIKEVAQKAGYNLGDIEEVFVIKFADLYISFNKSADEVLYQAWKTAFEQMKADGTFKTIYAKWFPGETPP